MTITSKAQNADSCMEIGAHGAPTFHKGVKSQATLDTITRADVERRTNGTGKVVWYSTSN
jgi:hypothetical protein